MAGLLSELASCPGTFARAFSLPRPPSPTHRPRTQPISHLHRGAFPDLQPPPRLSAPHGFLLRLIITAVAIFTCGSLSCLHPSLDRSQMHRGTRRRW